MQRILVTGGAGFIGAAIVRQLLTEHHAQVLNVDKLTYAADLSRLQSIETHDRYSFENADICDPAAMARIFAELQPNAVIHAAAESHVDRSIMAPASFIQTNINGTHNLLEISRNYYSELTKELQQTFRFLQVSTDEVYGDIGSGTPATEISPYRPSSPYAASKAAADHMVLAWARTYGLPILITHSSNNFGPGQHCEKLIPRIITRAMRGETLPVFGSGKQIRDWLYVEDNANAIIHVLREGKAGEAYNVAANHELSNIEVVEQICQLLDQQNTELSHSHATLIKHVEDRPGHDFRYALNCEKMTNLDWGPKTSFQQGLKQTVESYS